jgi:hypothetical protein
MSRAPIKLVIECITDEWEKMMMRVLGDDPNQYTRFGQPETD